MHEQVQNTFLKQTCRNPTFYRFIAKAAKVISPKKWTLNFNRHGTRDAADKQCPLSRTSIFTCMYKTSSILPLNSDTESHYLMSFTKCVHASLKTFLITIFVCRTHWLMGKWQTWRPYTIATHVSDELVTTLQAMGKWQTGLSLLQFLPMYINLSIESNKTPKLQPEEFYRWQHSPCMFVLFGLGHPLWQHHLHLLILSFTLAEILSSPIAFISFTNSSNSPNLHLSCYISVCVCINISTLLLWNEKIKKIPANFRNLFQKILSMSNSLKFHTLILAFQDTQKLTPRSR